MSLWPSVEILVVEDNPYDLEMTLRGPNTAPLANRVHVAHDAEEALQFLF